MNCKLPHISALDNSRQFLIDLEAIDDSNKILDDIAFDSIVKELEQDNIKAYQVSGKPWLRDVTKGGEIAIPNIEVLNKIDQKRKDLGLYKDQLSAEISDQIDELDTTISRNQRDNVAVLENITKQYELEHKTVIFGRQMYVLTFEVEEFLLKNNFIEKIC